MMDRPRASYVTHKPEIVVVYTKYTINGNYTESAAFSIEDAQLLYDELGNALLEAGIKK